MRVLFAVWFCVAASCSSTTAAPVDASTNDSSTDAGDDTPHVPRPGDPCTTRLECDDGVFCNGAEECLAGGCTSARNAACRDPGGCAKATCDEASGGCSFDPSGTCADGICRVDVGCTKPEGCTTDVDCDDMRSCTDDHCDAGACVHVPVDARCPAVGSCGVGVCLGDAVADDVGCGAKPDASRCAGNEGCSQAFACAPLKTSCESDRDCTDGSSCDGVERCLSGACVHGERTTCIASSSCHHAFCATRAVGDPYCKDVKLPRCP